MADVIRFALRLDAGVPSGLLFVAVARDALGRVRASTTEPCPDRMNPAYRRGWAFKQAAWLASPSASLADQLVDETEPWVYER